VPTERLLDSNQAATQKVCDCLIQSGLLKPEQAEAVYSQVQRSGDRAEEVILALGLVAEVQMLKSLATAHRVRFISSERLAKADLTPAVLDMVPQRFAEHRNLCPVVFDPATHALTVVTPNPGDLDALREVQLASGAREIKAVLARPAAVKALLAKAYGGDIHAFALLDRQAQAQFQAMLNVYDRNLVTEETVNESVVRAEAKSRRRDRVLSERDLAQGGLASNFPRGPESIASSLELMNVLVSLLETNRADLRGHSSQVARLANRFAERMGLDEATSAALSAAAYVHDLGKMGQYHLTTLNCSQYDGHRIAAQKVVGIPRRLLEPARLPPETVNAVDHMYERFDGKGFPGAIVGKEIPLEARVLAIADTYADLTQNPRNPFRKVLSPSEACTAIAQHKGGIFDPNLVDLFRHMVLGEDLKARLLANSLLALLIDPDPEETTVLELRLIEQGFVVRTVRSAEQALPLLAASDVDVVVSEVDLGPNDGLVLLAETRKSDWGKDLPWVVYTRRQDRATTQRAFELGAIDIVNKPASAEMLVAKLRALLDQRATRRQARGVSGSLREMNLPDMVQILYQGRKSGNLRIRAREGTGEIHFAEGNVVNALWGEARGEAAFFEMLKLADGEFSLDPSFAAPARVIQQSCEALLLEGMRRIDEGTT
jgi:response regulator RpfG family c-di-GMP phosphodiesterase